MLELVEEQKLPIPRMLQKTVLGFMRRSVKNRAGFDIYEVRSQSPRDSGAVSPRVAKMGARLFSAASLSRGSETEQWRAPFSLLACRVSAGESFCLQVSPLDKVQEAFVPALFGHAEGDTFVMKHHSERLHQQYAGEKNLIT